MIKKLFFLSLIFVFSSSLIFAGDGLKVTKVTSHKVPSFAGYAKNRIVIKFDDSIIKNIDKSKMLLGRLGINEIDEVSAKFNVKVILKQFPGAKKRFYNGRTIDLSQWHKFYFKNDIDVIKAVNAFRSLKGVIDVQPVGIHAVYANSNDPKLSEQWHLSQANDADIDAPEAWDIETGDPNIIVAILDTGVRYFHKDLGGANASFDTPENSQGNMWINNSDNNNNGIDDDNNGYIDDWIGWDFVANESVYSGEDGDTPDNDPRDFNGHGTHVAGIVGAINNNNYAVASPAGGWNNGSQSAVGNGVKIMPLRIGWSARFIIWEVGYVGMDYAAEAFYYAADNGANIASCSWGSSNSGGLGDALDYFIAGGGLVFKAAGNDDNEVSDYMLNRADVVGVASTDENDVKSDFSTYGTFVDISAPGSNILSTYHDHNDAENDYVASLSGTSMATPLTAGVAALVWSKNLSWSADQVKQRLFDTADDIYVISGNSSYQGKLGAGRVNAYNAVNDGNVCNQPTAQFVGDPTSGDTPLTVSFTDQSTNNPTSWSWDFGDGSTSTQQNPSHTYNTAGTYNVSLTATNDCGSGIETKTNYITVSDPTCDLPVAEFSGTPTSGNSPLTVSFTDQSTNNPTSWSWDFGDGSSSTQQNPSHTYNSAGSYTVSLTATNSCGANTKTKIDYITVTTPSQNQTVLVQSVDVTIGGYRVITQGIATVKIVDENGTPVSGATVSGNWSGDANDSDEFTTDSNGEGTASSDFVFRGDNFTFCVTNVTKSGYVYDETANTVTCGNSDGTSYGTDKNSNELTVNSLAKAKEILGDKLHSNYPDPFNPSTNIMYYIQKDSHVKVEIYNILGKKVKTLFDGEESSGIKSVTWNAVDDFGSKVVSGYYIYRITSNHGDLYTGKLLLLK